MHFLSIAANQSSKGSRQLVRKGPEALPKASAGDVSTVARVCAIQVDSLVVKPLSTYLSHQGLRWSQLSPIFGEDQGSNSLGRDQGEAGRWKQRPIQQRSVFPGRSAEDVPQLLPVQLQRIWNLQTRQETGGEAGPTAADVVARVCFWPSHWCGRTQLKI